MTTSAKTTKPKKTAAVAKAQREAKRTEERLLSDIARERSAFTARVDGLFAELRKAKRAAGVEAEDSKGAERIRAVNAAMHDTGYVTWGVTREVGPWRVRLECFGGDSWQIKVFYRFRYGEHMVRRTSLKTRSQAKAQNWASYELADAQKKEPKSLPDGWCELCEGQQQKQYAEGFVAKLSQRDAADGWELRIEDEYDAIREDVSYERRFGHKPAHAKLAKMHADRVVAALAALVTRKAAKKAEAAE